jgi:hypothetical protein
VREDLGNIQRDAAKLKQDIIVTRRMMRKKFIAPSMKKGKLRDGDGDGDGGNETDEMYDIPDGIIAPLTRACGGKVHDHDVIDVMYGTFEKETHKANPRWGALHTRDDYAAKNAVDLEVGSIFCSAFRDRSDKIPHTRNNWVRYDFKERRIVPTHYTVRSYRGDPGRKHLKLWLIETKADGESWREVAREENNKQLKGCRFSGTFAIADSGECRFIRLVNIGRNHFGEDRILISAWEIFGSLLE